MPRALSSFILAASFLSLCFIALAADVPRPEYPEPQFMRSAWMSLNGQWDFAFDDQDQGLAQRWQASSLHSSQKITVPYCFESQLSGIHDPSFHPVFWYRRSFEVPKVEPWIGKHVLMHFGAVDYRALVWLNGLFLGDHEGGGVPFSFDITAELKPGSNTVTVRVEDPPTDKSIPRGKQYWEPKSEGIFYTRTSGIWQPVWIESTGSTYFKYVHVTAGQSGTAVFHGRLNANPGGSLHVAIDVVSKGTVVRHLEEATVEDRVDATLSVPAPQLWSPDSPSLYDLRYTLSDGGNVLDRVESYIGFRTLGL
jgi:beta-galactosidase/beta-glucuronidase